MITTMAVLVIIVPFLYLFFVRRSPHSFLVQNFIWIVLLVLLGVLLSGLFQKRDR